MRRLALSMAIAACATSYGQTPEPPVPPDGGPPSGVDGGADVVTTTTADDASRVDATTDVPDAVAAADTGTDAPPPELASCKEVRDAGRSVGDGRYTLKGGVPVYCNMTLNGGGWTLIANVPLSPDGNWEENAKTLAATIPLTDIAFIGMMLPASVDQSGIPYAEVLFTDTQTNNWFTVDKASAFYTHNYLGTCRDNAVIENNSFQITGRSSGTGNTLKAWWANGCPNGSDIVTTGPESCGSVFVHFDSNCNGGSTTRLRAYVR